MDEEDEKLIKEYAKTKNITVSSLSGMQCWKKLKMRLTIDLYHVAMKQHITNPQVVSFDEMMKEIDF
ncbi:MAG: DUF6290 family protein [Trichococcus flocculiformis]